MRKAISFALVITLGFMTAESSTFGQAKPFTRVTEEQARAALKVAAASTKDNSLDLQNNFQKEIRKIAPDYDNDPFKIYDRQELQVLVFGPAQMFISAASENLRTTGSIGTLEYPKGATVYIAPVTLDAPNITKVTATRDGKEVDSLKTDLKETEMSTSGAATIGGARGETKKVHEGSVIFPVSTFDPGAKVVVTASPASGHSLSREMADRDLKKIQ